MKKALCISWFHYHPRVSEGHRVLFENWLKQFEVWCKEIDCFYLIDQGMEFTQEDEDRLKKLVPETYILKSEIEEHHWGQFKWALPKIDADAILMLDNDVVITRPGVVKGWFDAIEEGYDFVGSFDGSGGLRDQVQKKFPLLKAQNATRMGSYYFIWTKTLLDKLNFNDFAPTTYEVGTYIPELDYTTIEGDWSDSFGLFTIKMLASGAKVKAISDPRDSIYLQPEGNEWIINKEPENPNNLGYYHIRNGNLANYVITSKECGNKADYHREINSNKRELLRSLAWFQYMDSNLQSAHQREINELVIDLGASLEKWSEYMEEFKKYHAL